MRKPNEEDPIEKLIEARRRACISKVSISGVVIKQGDIVRIAIRGRRGKDLEAIFKCFNPHYGQIVLITDEGEMVLRMSEVRYIMKPKGEESEQA